MSHGSRTNDRTRRGVTAEGCLGPNRNWARGGAVNDAETVARLTDLAEECECKLSAMADRFDAGSTD